MKKLFIVIASLLLLSSAGFCASKKNDIFSEMDVSNRIFKQTCVNVSNNFRSDHLFSGYIRNKCMLFETDKARALEVVFPLSNKAARKYGVDYYRIKSDFVISMNDRELANLKNLVNQYCDFNEYKYLKKNSNACSSARVEWLFRFN